MHDNEFTMLVCQYKCQTKFVHDHSDIAGELVHDQLLLTSHRVCECIEFREFIVTQTIARLAA